MNIFIDTEDMEERYGDQLYQDYLVEQNKNLQQENQQLKEDYNKVVHEATEFESKVYELQQRIDKTIEVINTQMKLAEGGTKDNLRIIKFYLIKGECSMYDLTTEEDYKY